MSHTELALDQGDAGRQVDVVVGQTVSIGLEENPSTGYRWAIDRVDARVIALESADFMARSEGVMGSPGARIFRFKVIAPGQTELALKQWRPWQGEESVVERFAVNLHAVA